jgi:5,5'-dehydrodivanillate O-demethylase
MVFAYLGPEPAPLLPRWEPFTCNDAWLEVGIVGLPCNWLQCMEDSMDPDHLEGLYGYAGVYQEKTKAERSVKPFEIFPTDPKSHKKIGFDPFEYGIIKCRVVEGITEYDAARKTGHLVVFPFPQILFVGSIVTAIIGPVLFGSGPLTSYAR